MVFADGRADGVPSTNNQLSFTVKSLDELRTMYHRVVAEGVENLLPRNHGNVWSVYFDDPEGNNIEVYLDSPFHIPQPFGEFLDFEKSDDEIVQITEARCRETEGFKPRSEWSAERAKNMDLTSRAYSGKLEPFWRAACTWLPPRSTTELIPTYLNRL